jgi:hypothetical protein
VRQIVGMASAPGRTFRIETDFAPIPLAPDQAVPLSLLLTEGSPTRSSTPSPSPARCRPDRHARSSRAATGGRARIENTARHPVALGGGTGLGSQLVGAFASQLGGGPIGRGALRPAVEFG